MARTRISSTRTNSNFGLNEFDQILAKIQFGILIAAAVIVPLAVFPESNFVDITSTPKTTILRMLGTLQGGILLSRLVLSFVSSDQNRVIESVRAIKANQAVAFILGSIVAVTVISIISAALAILPAQSWWGRVPAAFESGEFTALMYVILSISTIISYREFSSGSALWNSLTATAILAGLVGFFQYLGWSPLDISTTHSVRLTGTNGNPIFFGAMLVVLAPAAVGYLIFRHQSSSEEYQRYWLAALAIASFVLAISLFGTASRGPWVGAFAGGITAVILLLIYGCSASILRPLAVAGTAIGVAALTIIFVDPTPPERASEGVAAESSAVSSTFDGVGRTSTLDLRVRYWTLSADMSADRAPVPYTNDAPKFVRLLFGYGPDMFRFAGTYFADSTTFTRRLTAAHNDPINRLVEQGILGLIAWIALWLSIAYGCWTLVRRAESVTSNPTAWLSITISAAFAARFVEQMFGSPTPGGVLVFWILIGALAAMLMKPIARSTNEQKAKSSSIHAQYASYVVIGLITIGSVVLAWDKGANYLIANQMASFQNRGDVVTIEDAVNRLEQTTKLAPDVPRYWNNLAELEHGRAASTDNPKLKAEALYAAYEYDLKGYEANPLEVNSIYKLAFSAWESGLQGHPELQQEAVRLYEILTEIIPSDKLAQERLQILTDYLAQ